MNTTFNISKVITRIQSGNGRSIVTNHKMGELVSMISGLESFEFAGLVPVEKFNKYHLQIMDAGFMVANVISNEPMFGTGVDFRIVYAKCN